MVERMENEVSLTDGGIETGANPPTTHRQLAVDAYTPPPQAVFSTDHAAVPGRLTQAEDAAFLAELAAHTAIETPLCIGVFGPAGSGKTSFLSSLVSSVDALTGASANGSAGPFLANIVSVRIEAQPGGVPAASIVHQTFTALAASHPRLVADASHAGSDPRAVAREAGEHLNEARQRLDTERRSLDDMTGRQARLIDSVLFETAGSRVDSYARTNRARIERSLTRFGLAGDPINSYKNLIRDASEPGGSLARGPGLVRAFWSYRGQSRLVVTAIVLFLIAWGLAALMANQDLVVTWLRSSSDKMGPVADWSQAHIEWLHVLRELAVAAGVIALAINVLRGFRFLQPVLKGVSLLRGDIEARRRDLDSLIAHQTRRVDSLAEECDSASQQAADAEGRLAKGVAAGLPTGVAVPGAGSPATARERDAADAFFAALGTAMAAGTNDRLASSASAPARLVVAIDGFDRLTNEHAASFLLTAHDLLNRPGFVTVIAADGDQLAAGLAEADPALATAKLNRVVQIPYKVGHGAAWAGGSGLVHTLLSGDTNVVAGAVESADATRSSLDLPWSTKEADILAALAATAGQTPRAVKRFVNLYRVARADPHLRGANPQELAALAVGLALDSIGTPSDIRMIAGEAGPDYGFGDDLKVATTATEKVLGRPFDSHAARRGFETARLYTARS